jgi:hypothetical protein
MPLKLNVGLSRKVGEANYGSRGTSVDVELEVDSSLVNEPDKLKDRIRQLFGLIRTSLADELNGNNGHASPAKSDSQAAPQPAGSNGQGAGPRPATQSQVKALFAITKGQGINLARLVQERFQVRRADDLNIKQASQLIEELKKSETRAGG